MYLPPKKYCNRFWFREVLKEDKYDLIFAKDVKHVKVTKLPEISLKKIIPQVMVIDQVRKYLPPGLDEKA